MKLIKNACVCVRQSAAACVCGCVAVCVWVCGCVAACFCQMGGLKWPAGCCSMPWAGAAKGCLAGSGRNFIHRFINVRNALLATPLPLPYCHTVFLFYQPPSPHTHTYTNVATSSGVDVGGLRGRGNSNNSSTFFDGIHQLFPILHVQF